MSFPIKICGITRVEDALLAEEWGAFAVGFIFYPKSPRSVAPETAQTISRRLGKSILRVGVFVDAPLETVRDTISAAGLNAVQLHGAESPEYAQALKDGVTVIKAFRVGEDFDPAVLHSYRTDFFLLDTFVQGNQGGTGKTFNWRRALPCREYGNILLAGGLHAGNVCEAIRIAAPWGVDISSGVESAPGIKDARKMKALFHAIGRDSEKL
jgi:phosphoribosylanthranilate isomerase